LEDRLELVKEELKEISLADLQTILDYLQKQPYHQVHELVNIIINVAEKE
jgi:hypothetical protein